MIPFVKGHGLGNDYLVINEADLSFPLTPLAIQRICHRNWGIGSDGILLLVESSSADFGLRIFNPDGSEAEKSGNGLRIFSKYLHDHGHTKETTFTVETKGGVVECQCQVSAGRVDFVTVEMGRATFRAPDIPMHGPDREVVGVPLQVNDHFLRVTAVSVGNPHCVVFRDSLDEPELKRLGPLIERHPSFPNRTNVQFAKVLGRDRVQILIWERGAGYTLASGSSSCGAASAAVKNRLCDYGSVTVTMPGGELMIEVRPDWSLRLRGPAEEVCTGRLSQDLLDALRRNDPIPGVGA
jgi:diaminopimelate epimerase